MARVKRGTTTRAKHNRILDQAKGYYGRRKNTIRIARQAVEKPVSMLIATVRLKSVLSAHFGFSVSTLLSAQKA